MDRMLIAFWALSILVFAANISLRLVHREAKPSRLFTLFPPVLSPLGVDRKDASGVLYAEDDGLAAPIAATAD